MAFESYDLASLRTEVKSEFGLSGTSKDSVVDKTVNDAIRWIIRKRDSVWPWQLKDLTIDVAPQAAGVIDVTQDLATMEYVSGTAPTDPTSTSNRQIIGVNETAISLTDGLLCTDYTGTTLTVDAKYVGDTELSATYSLLTGYYILPEDFRAMRVLVDTSIAYGRVIHRHDELLEWIRRNQTLATGLNMVYDVTKDPLLESNPGYSHRLFLLMYPYPGSRRTIRGRYVANHQTLVADGDIPLIPQNDRDVIFRVANWMFAMKLKDANQIGAYKAVADEAMNDMLRFYEFTIDDSDDATLDFDGLPGVPTVPGMPDWRMP
jgi:hypothetical protein